MRSIAYPFRFRSRRVLALVVALVSFSMPLNLAVAAEESSAEPALNETSEGTSLFRNHIRELLAHKCAVCHAGADAESGFDLATREGLLAGGELGPAIAPGNAAKSPLVEMVAHRREPHMPQEGDRLTNEEIALVARWIDLGAPYDKPLLDDADLVEWTKRVVPESAKAWWAFQPLHRIEPPKVENEANAANPIDRFVVARLENEDIQPNAPASRRTLIRRAYLDLIGLPPTPDEVDAFLQDDSAEAWSRVLDQLLASGHYGERWGRHWLDVARFGESHGFEQDYNRPHAYHYRDFVIKALNRDMPYDQFVRWQVAGDEIAPEEPLALAATGFLGAGVFPTQLTEKEFESARYDELDDMVRTLGTAMLGVTIGCARCHDHKFDAIPQADYYRMVANFTTTIRSETEVPLTSVSYPERFQRPEGAPPEPEFATLMVSTEGLKPLKHHADGRGFPHFYPKTHYLRRGDVNHKEEVAEPAFLQVLTSAPEGGPHWHQSPPPAWRTSYRRRALANWITDTDYGAGALLARVIVNRLWQHHFGRGIVATPSDFGKQGQPPSHPELLEYLAARLVREDWQLKPIHRLIMESATYQQSSEHNARAAKLDPENNLLWRYEPRRLEAEVIRDILLAVSGELDRTMYGPGTLDEGQKRRSIYFMVKRSKLIPMLQTFDAPRADVGIAARPRTTVAPQSLLLMNNPHVRSYARSFAERVLSHSEGSVGEGVRHAYLLALCRPPTDKELSDGVAFVEQQRRSYAERKLPDAVELAMQDYCQVLFCLNEFLYVD